MFYYLFKFLTLTVKSSPERPPSTDDHDPHDPNYALGYLVNPPSACPGFS